MSKYVCHPELPGDLSAFHNELKAESYKYNFPKNLMVNVNEMPLYFDMIPSCTIKMKGAKDAKVKTTGAGKRHVTIVLAFVAVTYPVMTKLVMMKSMMNSICICGTKLHLMTYIVLLFVYKIMFIIPYKK